jgi:hypothetical protein
VIAKFLNDDPGVLLLGIQLSAKRTEQAALCSLGDALTGPSGLVPHFYRTWTAAKAAERATHLAVRRSTRRVVIPMVRRAIA